MPLLVNLNNVKLENSPKMMVFVKCYRKGVARGIYILH